MKYALVAGERMEAATGLRGVCPACKSEMIPHCGEQLAHHWKHHGKRVCDPWWENETEWHRAWKNQFPADWQEVVLRNKQTGEKHIADVRTKQNWVLEFQHSPIKREERQSRDAFYKRLVWVVDLSESKRDRKQLLRAFDEGKDIAGKGVMRSIYLDDCSLWRKWGDCIVVFDLGEPAPGDEDSVWLVLPVPGQQTAYVARMYRIEFIKRHLAEADSEETFSGWLDSFSTFVQRVAIARRSTSVRAQRPRVANAVARRRRRL